MTEDSRELSLGRNNQASEVFRREILKEENR